MANGNSGKRVSSLLRPGSRRLADDFDIFIALLWFRKIANTRVAIEVRELPTAVRILDPPLFRATTSYSLYHQNKLIRWYPLHQDWCLTKIEMRVCRGVTTPTPFVDFSERSLYRARIAFLWGATAISKIDTRFFISSLIGLKFGRPLEGDNTQNRTDFDFWILSPKTFGAPLNFAFALRPMGQKKFKSALLELQKLFWADIFTRTRPEVWKLTLRFWRMGKNF